jgi:glutamate--glyoxylate aminotransferase
MGIYSPLPEFECVRRSVAQFIEKRDSTPTDWKCIRVTQGASVSIADFLNTVITGPYDRVMLPIPHSPLYVALVALFRAQFIPYHLIEEECSSFDMESITTSVRESRDRGIRLKAFVAVNPGNPAGTVLSRDDLKRIIIHCEVEGIVLIGDAVYQENVCENAEWNCQKSRN